MTPEERRRKLQHDLQRANAIAMEAQRKFDEEQQFLRDNDDDDQQPFREWMYKIGKGRRTQSPRG